MVIVGNNDSFIINRDTVIIDIIAEMTAQVPCLEIRLNGEGPCADSIGLYTLLDQLCERFNYPKKQINIVTCNLIEQHTDYCVTIEPQMFYLENTVANQINTTKIFDPEFKHFGHFIGHGNHLRLSIASYLYAKFRNQTLQTYHCDVKSEYHRQFLALDDTLFYNYTWNDFDQAVDLIKHSPLTLDKIDQYPILMPATLNITKVYPNFFVEIASLTYFTGTTFYIDEKIWRPVNMLTPFMVQGPQNFIKHLKNLGFQTFSRWWNEGYTEDPAEFQLAGIRENINCLAQLTQTQLSSMYADMMPVLEHNRARMQELVEQDFLNV